MGDAVEFIGQGVQQFWHQGVGVFLRERLGVAIFAQIEVHRLHGLGRQQGGVEQQLGVFAVAADALAGFVCRFGFVIDQSPCGLVGRGGGQLVHAVNRAGNGDGVRG